MSGTLSAGKILFVGAHCDDIEIGCGGTAALYSALGNPIAFAVATFGRDEKDAKKRKTQAVKAAATLRVSEEKGNLFFGRFGVGELNQKEENVRRWLKGVSRDFNPDTVYLHRSDNHTDHQAIFTIGNGIFQDMSILHYFIPRSGPDPAFEPNHVVDITQFIKIKLSMCACHKGQAKDYISRRAVVNNGRWWYDRWFLRKASKDGYAEPFIIYAHRSLVAGTKWQTPTIGYGARVVQKPDGTHAWEH